MYKSLITALIFLSLMATPLLAEQPRQGPAYLVVVTLTNTAASRFTFNYHKVNNIKLCMELADNARLEGVPHGGDAEAAVVVYCAPSRAKIWSYKGMSDE
jgi:hypothetical protein